MTPATLARVLELDGHQVFCVFDGLSVTEQVASFDPHVVLLDIGLPGLDGYQVAQELRRRFAPEELMLVAVTGYGGEKDHSRAMLAGFDHYLDPQTGTSCKLRCRDCFALGKSVLASTSKYRDELPAFRSGNACFSWRRRRTPGIHLLPSNALPSAQQLRPAMVGFLEAGSKVGPGTDRRISTRGQ